MKIEGKVAFITGGSSGLGLAAAQMLKKAGAKVAIAGSTLDKLEAAQKELGEDCFIV